MTNTSQPESVSPIPNSNENDEKTVLQAQADQYRQQHNELLEEYEQLLKEMKRKKIESFEELAEHDKDSVKILIQLAQLTPAAPMEGNNIGLFGSTSTGKSTMLNALLGKQNIEPGAAQTGVGETTKEVKAYPGTGFTLWDVPGRNDEISYLSMECISFFKGLTQRLILITATVKENSSMMKLLDELGLKYSIVFNKFDKVDEDEQSSVKEQIHKEIKDLGLKQVDKVFFVSAKCPTSFPDWSALNQHLNNFSFSS